MLFYSSLKYDYLKRKGRSSFHDSPPDQTDEVVLGKRVSPITSVFQGSLTVEASMVLPLFIGAVVTLIFFIQVIQIQIQIQKALYNQTMKVMGYGYYIDSTDMATEAETFLQAGYIKLKVIEELGDNFFDNGCIVNGKQGFVLYLTNVSDEGLVDVAMRYNLQVPFDIFGVGKLSFVARARCAIWTGKDSDTTEWNVNMVYMTAQGQVYHIDKECTYIKLDISSCRMDELDTVRNASGGIYYPCNLCCGQKEYDSRTVYITQYGTRYHMMEYCSNLKSNVFAIEKEVAEQKYKVCSKCGSEGEQDD